MDNYIDQWEKSQLDDYELRSSQEALSLAAKQNQDLANQSRGQFDIFYDKILLYSAGAFSFSVALVGLVVGDRINALAKAGFLYPNIYWLYLSLGGYLITCAMVLLSRRFDALYLGHFGMANYCKRKREQQEAIHQKLQNSQSNEILVTKGGTRESEIEICKSNIQKLRNAEHKNANARDREQFLKRLCHQIAELIVVVATILLLFFTIQLTQAMIWG